MELLGTLMAGTGLSAEECGALVGCSASTWRALCSARRRAASSCPPPLPAGFDPMTGLRVWDGAAVLRWLPTRPGPGGRRKPAPVDRRRGFELPAAESIVDWAPHLAGRIAA